MQHTIATAVSSEARPTVRARAAACRSRAPLVIERLAARHALEIVDVERLETHGGSLRVYLAHAGSARRASPAVKELQDYEAANGFLEILPWNLKDEIVQQMRHVRDWGGQFIVPIPEVHVIDPARSAS